MSDIRRFYSAIRTSITRCPALWRARCRKRYSLWRAYVYVCVCVFHTTRQRIRAGYARSRRDCQGRKVDSRCTLHLRLQTKARRNQPAKCLASGESLKFNIPRIAHRSPPGLLDRGRPRLRTVLRRLSLRRDYREIIEKGKRERPRGRFALSAFDDPSRRVNLREIRSLHGIRRASWSFKTS